MELVAKLLHITAGGKRIAILGDETAASLGVHSGDRISVAHKQNSIVAIANVAKDIPENRIGFYEETSQILKLKDGDRVEAQLAQIPESLIHVRAKLRGQRLREKDITKIVQDVVERHLSEIEISAFLTALSIHGLSMGESEAMSRAMVETGKTLSFGEAPILDKHSIGGIPGDKTSILVVPIIAAAGMTIPKTSSRAVTSPAGTADRVETLCPVNLTIDEIRETVNKTNGCLVWGGSLELAPADDLFIQVEYPLGIDPLLLPSIMSKKKAIGATHVVIDIPTGAGAKIKTMTEAYLLASDFVDLGRRLGLTIQCALTFGEQPLGCAVGPALEAREALTALMGESPRDLYEKATSLAGLLFEMVGIESGKHKAERIIQSGRAEQKLREIIEAQGGNPDLKPEEIKVGDKTATVAAGQSGRVLWISSESIAQIAREAGAPREKGAGVILKTKLGDIVKKDSSLFEIYAERGAKLESALELAKTLQPYVLSRKAEEQMILDQVPANVVLEKSFPMER
jgi:AMP phosphorylase